MSCSESMIIESMSMTMNYSESMSISMSYSESMSMIMSYSESICSRLLHKQSGMWGEAWAGPSSQQPDYIVLASTPRKYEWKLVVLSFRFFLFLQKMESLFLSVVQWKHLCQL